jgi:hypothetical protein
MIICADLNLGRRVMKRKFVTIALRHEASYMKTRFFFRKPESFLLPSRTSAFFG